MLIRISDFNGNELKLSNSLLGVIFPHALEDLENYKNAMNTLGIESFNKVIDGKVTVYIHK